MARIRTIKPEFFTSEDIVGLSPMARLLYVATWCEADKEGRLVWKPLTFKLRYFPGDNCDIQAMCQELEEAGLVVPYGDHLAYIPTFCLHQHINPRESDSRLPDPDASARVDDASRRVGHASARVGHASPRDSDACARDSDAQGGREGKGKEGNTRAHAHATPPPPKGELAGFVRFWETWPASERKGAKARCLEVWKKEKLEQHVEAVCAHVEAMRVSLAWTKDCGQFIPAPLVYLNQKRWDGASSNHVAEQQQAFI